MALPLAVTFVPVGFAAGAAAKASGFTGIEVALMSVLIYAAPVQFAVAELWAAGAPLTQMVLTGLFLNLRFLLISLTMAPHFRYLRSAPRALAAQATSMSAFAATFTAVQRASGAEGARIYLSAAIPLFPFWVVSCLAGFALGARVPSRYDEALRLVFPLFVAAMLAADLREWRPLAAAAGGFLLAPLALALSPRWGLLLAALAAATLVTGADRWFPGRASRPRGGGGHQALRTE